MKKLVITTMILTLVACMFAGGLGAATASADSLKIKLLSENTGGKDADEMVIFEKAMSEALGMEVSIEMPPSDYQQIVMQKMQAGEKYDLLYCTQLFYLNLISQGALVDLTDEIMASPMYANVDQSEWDAIAVDGRLYAGFNKKEVHKPVLLNKAHLEKAGIDYTTIEPTLDGYYNVFKALKGVIDTPNYYPYNVVLNQVNNLQPWMASAGLKTGVVLDADGKTYVPIASDDAAPVWDWLRKLYAEELLDPACFVDQTKDLRAKIASGTQSSSVVVDWAAFVGIHNSQAAAGGIDLADYELVSLPGAQTPDGSYMLTKGAASLWAIPVNAENPEGAFKALEYMASQEGGDLLSIGIKDHDYTVDASGVYAQTEIGAQHGNDHGAPIPIYKDYQFPFGLATGMGEALASGQYASIEMPTEVQKDYEEVCGKWAGQIVKGEVDTLDGLKGMRDELLAREVTQK